MIAMRIFFILLILMAAQIQAADPSPAPSGYTASEIRTFEIHRHILDDRFGKDAVERDRDFFLAVTRNARALKHTESAFRNMPANYAENKDFLLKVLGMSAGEDQTGPILGSFDELPDYGKHQEFFFELLSLVPRNSYFQTLWFLQEDYYEHKEFLLSIARMREGELDGLAGEYFEILPPGYGSHEDALKELFSDDIEETQALFWNLPTNYFVNPKLVKLVWDRKMRDSFRAFDGGADSFRFFDAEEYTPELIPKAQLGGKSADEISSMLAGIWLEDIQATAGIMHRITVESKESTELPLAALSSSLREMGNSRQEHAFINFVVQNSNNYGFDFNILHDDNFARTKLGNLMSPELIYLITGTADEIYTSSFRSLFDIAAFKLAGGEGVLDFNENNRTPRQRSLILKGAPMLFALGKRQYYSAYLPEFLGKAAYFGKLELMLPKDEGGKGEYFDIVVGGIGESRRNLFHYFPLLENGMIGSADKRGLAKRLIAARERADVGSESFELYSYALSVFRNILETGSEEEKRIAGELPTLPMPFAPSELIVGMGNERNINVLLYFAPGGGLSSGHYDIARKYFIEQGFALMAEQKGEGKWKIEMEKKIPYFKGGEITASLILAATDAYPIKNFKGGIISHRGHSSEVEGTFPYTYHFANPTLVFLGSCGGFGTFGDISGKLDGKLAFMGSRGVGRGFINNEMITEIINAAANGNSWHQLDQKIDKRGANFRELALPDEASFRLLLKK